MPHEIFFKWCNLVRFGVYLDQILSLKKFKNYHFYIKNLKIAIIYIREYMCVGPTKGTYRRDIKMLVNHDYIKQCIIFANKFFGWLYQQILFTFHSTDFCTHLYTSTHQFRLFCVCMLLVPYFLLNPPYTLLKPPLRSFAITYLIIGLHYCAMVTFPIKLFHTVLRKTNLIRGQVLAVKGGIKN